MNRRALLALPCALASGALGKKKKEEETQTLPMLKELPQTVAADPRHMAFHVTPLSGKGLLTHQIRDALKAVSRAAGGGPVLKLRAFVAGTGDLRRVRDMVSATFTERRQPLPVLSLVQSGGLPLEGAQVVVEAVSMARKPVNPQGLAFFGAQASYADDPLAPVPPLAVKARASLREALRGAAISAADVVRLTCYLSSLDRWQELRGPLLSEYSSAAVSFVQTRRAPDRAMAALEAVARLTRVPARSVQMLDANSESGGPQGVLVSVPQIVLSGAQVAFGYQDGDARLAFERLGKSLEQSGSALNKSILADYYPISSGIAAHLRNIRREYFDAAAEPASSTIVMEGLPGMDASFAVDVVALKS